jgi:hypothetical protein
MFTRTAPPSISLKGYCGAPIKEAQNPSAAEKVHEIHIELWPLNVISAKQTLSHGSEYPSRLVLPMIPARSSGFPVITGCPQTVSV